MADQTEDAELTSRLAWWLRSNRNTLIAAETYHSLDGKKVAYSTFRGSIQKAKLRGLMPATVLPPTDFDGHPPLPKLRVTVSTLRNEPGWSGDVLAIGDMHDSPRLDKRRFLWAGRAAVEWGVSRVVQIGDIMSFDSLCRYEGNDTLRGKEKPAFEADIVSGHQALSEFDRGLQGHDIEKHITLGNHEERALSFTNRTPEVAGILTGMVDNLFMSHKWTYSPFGLVFFIGSVGFVHVPLNKMGKPYGGKTALSRIGNDSVHDLVFGHSHTRGDLPCPKIGPNQLVTVLNLGCCLPQGYLEPYVGHASSGWWYGVHIVRIRDGRISSVQAVSMDELEERFGD